MKVNQYHYQINQVIVSLSGVIIDRQVIFLKLNSPEELNLVNQWEPRVPYFSISKYFTDFQQL